jgi:hypothetical protein
MATINDPTNYQERVGVFTSVGSQRLTPIISGRLRKMEIQRFFDLCKLRIRPGWLAIDQLTKGRSDGSESY